MTQRSLATRVGASSVRLTALLVWLPLIFVLGMALVVTSQTNVTMRELTQDPTTVLDGPFYVGYVSNLGNILWAAAVAICAFVVLVLQRGDRDGARRFFAWSGLFTAVLMIDDLFLLHDEVLPRHAGISGELYGILYVLSMAAYLVLFRWRLLAANYVLFGVALMFFGISVVVDLGSSALADVAPSNLVLLVEDGAKVLGIGTWMAFFATTGRDALGASPRADERQ